MTHFINSKFINNADRYYTWAKQAEGTKNSTKERNDVESVPLTSNHEGEDETVLWQYREESAEKR